MLLLDYLPMEIDISLLDVPHLPATVIYEEVLPSVVTALTSFEVQAPASAGGEAATTTTVQASYVRGSPYGGKGWDTADPTVGDVHQWNIWGGKELPYQEYGRMGGRFVRYAPPRTLLLDLSEACPSPY